MDKLSEEQRRRYIRQLSLPEIGVEGQRKLADAVVMIAGLGGLGSISSYYLAAAGVGRLRIIDHDRVALENLNRQILHTTSDIGRLKVDSAAEKLNALNAHCQIEPVRESIDMTNAGHIAAGCDLIVDATDNLMVRHALNRASVIKNIPFVFGAIDGWNGMASTFIPKQTACFACLFPQQGAEDREPVPALGPTAGIVAAVQSLESILILLGLTPRLANRLLDFRGLELSFRTISIEKNPNCSVCSTQQGGRKP
ncbi:MAG: HesA/MoeB/ThiF family protein [Deltaproteobacteria bacterium]|nr:HesA/MoeB/ThiF family protein [Deltaproteobacteria bacterium]